VTGGTIVVELAGKAVADAGAIRATARGLVDEQSRGHAVVATVPAAPRTSASLRELAGTVSASPDARELDMLLTAAGRISCALVAIAIKDLGHEALSLTGSQAGILTDAAHNRATIREVRADRVRAALAEGKIVLVAGAQGFTRETMDLTTLDRDDAAAALAEALGATRRPSAEP
jgi:aspartate kinase